MKEQYLVKFNYKKTDGFWVIGEDEYVEVSYNRKNEKRNHDKARAIIHRRYPGCSVVSVSYV